MGEVVAGRVCRDQAGPAALDKIAMPAAPPSSWNVLTSADRRPAWVGSASVSEAVKAAQRELPAEHIRKVHDPILRRMQALIGRGQKAGTFRSDLPGQWLTTTAFSLMHAAAEDAAAGRVAADDAPRLITATVLAALTPPAKHRGP